MISDRRTIASAFIAAFVTVESGCSSNPHRPSSPPAISSGALQAFVIPHHSSGLYSASPYSIRSISLFLDPALQETDHGPNMLHIRHEPAHMRRRTIVDDVGETSCVWTSWSYALVTSAMASHSNHSTPTSPMSASTQSVRFSIIQHASTTGRSVDPATMTSCNTGKMPPG